ncbi:MAG TPA: hypothetical protein VI790_00300, partial [Candidatus Nanoarchaeia archaeon]|nr:hypothetical protein [Candidatus Nanoarchaeia archaeon]
SPVNDLISDGSPFDFNISLVDNLKTVFSCLIYDNDIVISSFTTEKINETVYSYNYTPVTEGAHSLNASCTDLVGLMNFNGVSFTVDLYKPNITVNNPLFMPYNYYPGMINFSVNDVTLDSVSLFVNSVNISDFSVIDSAEILLSESGDYFINDTFIFPNSTLLSLVFLANDSFGRANEPFDYFLFIDNKTPEVNLLSPVNASNLTVSNITFMFDANDDFPVINCNISINNSVDEFSVFTLNNSVVSVNKSLSDGYYDWFVYCSDSFNETVSSVRRLKVDTLGPAIVIYSPVSGVYPTNVLDINVSVVDNLSAIDSVNVFVDGTEVLLSNIGDYWFFDDYSFDNNSPITLLVTANDSNGLNSTAQSIFNVDNTPPVVSLFSPDDNSYVNSSIYSFYYTAYDDIAPNFNCSIMVNNGLVGSNNIVNGTNNNFTNSFSDGSIEWFINCSDGINEGVSEVRKLTFDTVKPGVLVLTPANITYGFSELLVNISAVDAVGVSFSFDGESFSPYLSEFNRSFIDGVHYIIANAVDNAGNTNNNSVFFSVDTSAPVVVISSSVNASFSSPNVLLSFTYSDYSPVYCAYSVDNSAFQVFPCVNLSIGPYSDNSFHSVRVMVNDSVGNSAVSNEAFFSVNF